MLSVPNSDVTTKGLAQHLGEDGRVRLTRKMAAQRHRLQELRLVGQQFAQPGQLRVEPLIPARIEVDGGKFCFHGSLLSIGSRG